MYADASAVSAHDPLASAGLPPHVQSACSPHLHNEVEIINAFLTCNTCLASSVWEVFRFRHHTLFSVSLQAVSWADSGD